MKWIFASYSLLVVLVSLPRGSYAIQILQSDPSWKVSTHFENGWMNPLFDDAVWPTTRAPTRGRCDYYPDPIFFALPMWSYGAVEKGEAYFRKKIILEKPVLSARLRAGFDDDGDVYVNGKKVLSDRSGKTEKTFMDIDIAQELHKGENTLALYAIDSFGGCQWAQLDLVVDYDPGVTVDVPVLKQTDSQWSSDVYDSAVENKLTCGTTMADCGCATTSLAMLLLAHGVAQSPRHVPTNPKSLNTYMQESGICTQDGCASQGYVFGAVRWNIVNTYSAQAHALFGSPKIQYVPSSAYDLPLLKHDIDVGNPVILKDAKASHWFVGYGYRGDEVLINDPYFDRTSLADPAYAQTAGSMQRFEEVHSDFSLIEVFSKGTSGLVLSDRYGRRAGIDDTGHVYQEIPSMSVQTISTPNDTLETPAIHWIMISRPVPGPYFMHGAGFVYTATQDAREKMFAVTSDHGVEIEYALDDVSSAKNTEGLRSNACYVL